MKPKINNLFSPKTTKLKAMLRKLNLNTVCEEASCPNIGECFSKGTVTFMIMGDVCTRDCPYCNVLHSKPEKLDKNEPLNVAKAVKKLKLKYVVITSVNRDDLKDGGASHFAKTIDEVKKLNPDVQIEVLIPDFKYNCEYLKIVVNKKPDVINHNIETVKSLYKSVRPRGNYKKSLELIKMVKELDKDILTKSGLMVGLGETVDEIIETMEDLRKFDCDILTIGQYLQPSLKHLPVKKYYIDKEFEYLKEVGKKMGFKYVFSGKLVRSSYNASEVFHKV